MKKLFAIFLVIASLFALSSTSFAQGSKKKKKPVTRVEIETKDNFLLVGDLYFAPQKKPPRPLVVLLHSYGMKASDWGGLASDLRLNNYNVLALDLRGHGRSTRTSSLKYKSVNSFTGADWRKFPSDVITSIDFIKKNYHSINADEYYLIGADIGASAAVLAANIMKNKPKKMVLISPYSNFKGLDITPFVPKLTKTPIMVMASSADKTSAAQADIVSRLVHSDMKLEMYKTGGSGVLLLKRNPLSYLTIVNYIISGK